MAEQAGGYVSDEYAGTSLDAIRVMAATGAGVAILPDIYALSEAARGRDIQLARINHKQAERKISLIFKASLLEDEKVAILANLIRGEHNRIVRP
jgi:LysR family hydrogen peroxide-inducible transcriptional activator